MFCEFVHLRFPGGIWPSAKSGARVKGAAPGGTAVSEEQRWSSREGRGSLAFLGGRGPGKALGCSGTWHWRGEQLTLQPDISVSLVEVSTADPGQ